MLNRRQRAYRPMVIRPSVVTNWPALALRTPPSRAFWLFRTCYNTVTRQMDLPPRVTLQAVVEILERRRAENRVFVGDDPDWVFPTKDAEGRVTYVRETKEYRDSPEKDGKKVKILPTPHRLRDTFASAAHEAGIGWIDLKILMNHMLPSGGDVTAGYIRPSVEHLRVALEKVATFLVEKMRG